MDSDWDSLLKDRDTAIDRCLRHSTPMDKALIARFLLDGSNQESVPVILVRAQERMIAAMVGEDDKDVLEYEEIPMQL